MADTKKIDKEIANNLELAFSRRGRIKRIKRVFFFLFLIAASVAGYYYYKMKQVEPEKIRYRTENAQLSTMNLYVSATGNLHPTNKVDVGSELSGIIRELRVDYNDQVKVGDILAILDTEKLNAQVTLCRASLASARANVLKAQATLKEKDIELRRIKNLIKNRISSETEITAAEAAYERAKADLASSEASVMQSEANLQSNETDLKKAVIKSPVNGIVLTREIEIGQTVAASFQAPVLFTLAEDLTQMELQVDIDEADIGKVVEGQTATFTVDAFPKRKFVGEIIQVRYGAETVDGVVTYKTILKVENPDLLLRPGMTANVEITVRNDKNVLLIPNAAFRFIPPVVEEQPKESRGFIDSLLPHPPRMRSRKSVEQQKPEKEGQRCIYSLVKDEQGEDKLVQHWITVGDSNGSHSEVLEGDIKPGMPIVLEIIKNRRRTKQ